ncbi:uracil-DNA glycosylase family protein [Shewanella sp. AS1]|uniref:uracil-DNA glycosylase family protein n=1 Tax=Shewanella sp. AS1 TaxID=2907626 RepID=UPI001F36F63A|nr:uracil-DNA glycosylase family protein [Shewanella sp. AS1]MCE9679635.1 uracil-DNA glycosylase family protein [Shewanella sp. AS1]
MTALTQLITQIRACRHCEAELPEDVHPIIQASSSAKILIAGLAPGAAANRSGLPFDDASGDRLREWLGVTRQQFYDPRLFAILPMAFCYPGRGASGDLPPPKICADKWRRALLEQLPHIELTLPIGQYAQQYHFNDNNTVTARVSSWQAYGGQIMPLPHPSPRNNIWLKRHPWFVKTLLPELKQRVASIITPVI